MMIRALMIVLYLSSSLYAYSISRSSGGMKAIVALPESYKEDKSYPVMIVLHGMRENMYHSYARFKASALENEMILICPEGSDFNEAYIRSGKDDLRQIFDILQNVKIKHLVQNDKSFLVGFSRGGNVALELAMRYPKSFSHVISFFGFFNRSTIQNYFSKHPIEFWSSTQFLLVTGKDDFTEQSMRYAYSFFRSYSLSTQLWVYDNLKHGLPNNLPSIFKGLLLNETKIEPAVLALKNY